MTDTPPFDPPYKSLHHTEDGISVIETLADGSTRFLDLETWYVAVTDVNQQPKLADENATITNAPARRVQSIPGNKQAALYLEVPFSEKDNAKKIGARWDPKDRKWYVPHGLDVNNFKQWWPEGLKA
jgi:hypothetical protein